METSGGSQNPQVPGSRKRNFITISSLRRFREGSRLGCLLADYKYILAHEEDLIAKKGETEQDRRKGERAEKYRDFGKGWERT